MIQFKPVYLPPPPFNFVGRGYNKQQELSEDNIARLLGLQLNNDKFLENQWHSHYLKDTIKI